MYFILSKRSLITLQRAILKILIFFIRQIIEYMRNAKEILILKIFVVVDMIQTEQWCFEIEIHSFV